MAEVAQSRQVFRFGVFELDVRAGELRKRGLRLPIQGHPLQALAVLLDHPGEVVSREELRNRIWPVDTFVDFDHSLHNAIARLREALGDSSETPRYIETLPRRGYRFIGQVEPTARSTLPSVLASSADEAPASALSARSRHKPILIALAAVIVVVAAIAYRQNNRHPNPGIESLAILPLDNLSGDPSEDYFVDGMTDELITSLAKISSVRIISRTSSMHYKGVQKTLPQIARELNVDAIVEGTVSRSGNRIRVTAQLIDARRDRHLWAQDYDRELGDLVTLQNQIAREVAEEVRAKLTAGERVQLSKERPVNPTAYDAYLRGRFHWNKWNEEGLKKSIEYFNRAIERDPGYAAAWAGLSDAYDLLGDFGISPTQEVLPKAKEAAQKALQLDESLSEAHVSLGGALLHLEWSWPAAEKELLRAIALDPSNAMAHQWYGYYLIAMGRFEDAIREMKKARDLDPLSANKSGSLGLVFYQAGRYDEALQQYREMAELGSAEKAHFRLALTYEQKKMYGEALAEWIKVLTLDGKEKLAAIVEQEYLSSGYAEAKNIILRSDFVELEQKAKRGYVSEYDMAADCAELGHKDKALKLLETAFEKRDAGLIYLQVDKEFDTVRSDVRFQNLLRRIGLPQ